MDTEIRLTNKESRLIFSWHDTILNYGLVPAHSTLRIGYTFLAQPLLRAHEYKFSPLTTKHNPFYLKAQFVPQSKHLPFRL
jgi:hypothetical protein